MNSLPRVFLAALVLALTWTAWGQTPVKNATPAPEDVKILKDVGLGTDGKSLLDYLKKQTYPEADLNQMDTLIKNLGDDDFKVRESAYTQLIGLGKNAIVGLKQAEKTNDPEVRRRAVDLRQRLEAKVEPAIQVATARLISQMRPEGSAEVLLNFIPFAADLTVTDEVCKALASVAVGPKGVEGAIVKALEDKHPVKRGAAAEALVRQGDGSSSRRSRDAQRHRADRTDSGRLAADRHA